MIDISTELWEPLTLLNIIAMGGDNQNTIHFTSLTELYCILSQGKMHFG